MPKGPHETTLVELGSVKVVDGFQDGNAYQKRRPPGKRIPKRLLQLLSSYSHSKSVPKWKREVEKCVTIDHLRLVMEKRVPPIVREYYRGGADNEITLRDNVLAFERERFNPRTAVQLDTVAMQTNVLGHEIEMPVIAAPVGSTRMLWPQGEVAAATVARDGGTIYALSTMTGTDLEEVRSQSQAACWYQLYLVGGKEVATRSIERAKKAGYSALVLTVDTAVAGNRAEHERLGASRAITGTIFQKMLFAPQMLNHLSWLGGFYADGGMMEFRNVILENGRPMPYADVASQLRSSVITWDDLAWIRRVWENNGPILLKGVQGVEDAHLALEHGVDGIIISNHGGRQMDRVYPTLHILKEVAPALKDSNLAVLLDGGIRSGSDVAIALAYGANAVLAGRAYIYGLGAGGRTGVRRAFDILKKELEDTLRLLGCRSVQELNAVDHLRTYPFS